MLGKRKLALIISMIILWHNIFATYDNNYIRLYVDGQVIDSLHVGSTV